MLAFNATHKMVTTMIKLGQRIATLRQEKGWSQRELAERCGWEGQSRVGNYERNVREPSLHDMDLIARALGISVKELLFGEDSAGTAIGRITAYDNEDDLDPDDYVFIQRYDLKLSAGCGSLAWVVHEKDPIAFRRRFMDARRLDHRHLKAVYVRGDSMQPYLYDGDTVMIDTEDTTPRDGDVYAVCFDDEWFIKRIFKQPGGGLILRSDNSAYREISIKAEETGLIQVFGRVVWRGG